jgi:hypothetical protein
MRSTGHGEELGPPERPGAASGRPAPLSGPPALPRWESFPVADRHQLVRAVLRLARQVAVGPTGDRART